MVRSLFAIVGCDRLMTEMILRIDEVVTENAGDKQQNYLTELSANLTAALETYRRRHEDEKE
jgi:hypothetical protein